MSGVVVLCDRVRKTFPGAKAPALAELTVRAEAGRSLVVLGASGAGKSTLLRIVAGLETPDAGRVVVGDVVVNDPGSRVAPEKRHVGMVFQHLELWPHLSVAENVAFGLTGHPRRRAAAGHARVKDLAERVGIGALLDRSPATLSGGERQRVAIARALAPSPAVLLYDEPLANLDPGRRADLRRLLRQLAREEGTTLLYVTHDPEEAMEMGDEIAVLHRGRVVDRGTPADVYLRPSTLEGARALGPVTALHGRREGSALVTPLGRLAAAPSSAPEADVAVLRPEDVELGDEGPDAVVTESRLRGPDWAFTARLDDVEVLGRSERELPLGEHVLLHVRHPVALVPSSSAEAVA